MTDVTACPYCESEDTCDHLLLQVDLTFNDAIGGALYDDFRAKWLAILDENSERDDFNENEAFLELLDNVACLADEQRYWEFEGGPGQSSDYQAYFCHSAETTAKALSDWSMDDNKTTPAGQNMLWDYMKEHKIPLTRANYLERNNQTEPLEEDSELGLPVEIRLTS